MNHGLGILLDQRAYRFAVPQVQRKPADPRPVGRWQKLGRPITRQTGTDHLVPGGEQSWQQRASHEARRTGTRIFTRGRPAARDRRRPSSPPAPRSPPRVQPSSLPRQRRIGQEQVHFGGTDERGIVSRRLLPIEPGVTERDLDQLPHAVGHAGADDVVRRARLLQHPPHRVDVVAGKAPVAPRVEVPEPELCRAGPA